MKSFIVIVLTNIAQVLSTPAGACPKVSPVPVDENFVRGKFVITRHSDTEVFRKLDKSFEFIEKPILKKSSCWDFNTVLEDGSEYRPKIRCEYENISTQYCTIEKGDQEMFLSAKGTIFYTSTDNSTYVAGIACVSAKGAFWFIATSGENSIDSANEKLALESFEKIGLDTQKPAPKSCPITFKEFTLSDDENCK